MKKELSRNDLAAIKRAAESIKPLATKRDRLTAKIDELIKQRDAINERIGYFNLPIINLTGFETEDLVERDESGKLVFKYPDTIIPNLIPEETKDEVADIDENAVVDEVETTAAEAPFNPIDNPNVNL
jgi:septin family protein